MRIREPLARRSWRRRLLRFLEERKITSLIVVDGEGKVEGVLHLHDLWGWN